jgi:osmotically-inducible protein OsmY
VSQPDKNANVDRGNPFARPLASRGPRLAGRRDPLTPHQKDKQNVTRQRAPGVGDGRTRLEPSIDAAHIGVAANAGVVTLTGHVQSFPEKVAAERTAARVKGVKAAAEEIEVKLPYDIRRGDEDVAGAAIERLAWDASVPPGAIEIRVEKGWVTLNGEVDWHFQKEADAQAVRTLIGVVGVSNLIEIKPAVNADDVGQNITRALHRSWFYDPNTIRVSAQGGKIKLTEQVTTWNARDLAGATA